MRHEDIKHFARLITTVFETTVLHFSDGTRFHGYFEDNPVGTEFHTAKNQWNFVRYNDGRNSNVKTLVEGNDIERIEIVPRGQ